MVVSGNGRETLMETSQDTPVTPFKIGDRVRIKPQAEKVLHRYGGELGVIRATPKWRAYTVELLSGMEQGVLTSWKPEDLEVAE
jgi:hypothetical protein